MRVLVIDDSPEFRQRIAQYLGAAMPEAELTLWDPVRQGKPAVGFDWRRYDALLLDDAPGAGQDGLEWLREFRAEGQVPPTLVLRGASSTVLDRDVAERMGRDLPNGTFVEIPRAVHTLHEDNPEAVLAALRSFLGF